MWWVVEPNCIVRQDSLAISLGTGAQLAIGDQLTLKASAISQRNADNPNYAAGRVNVSLL